jgi:hypothetical protein
MSMWLSNQSLSLALLAGAGCRAVQSGALSLVAPAALRRAQAGMLKLITVVAGH